MTDVTAAGHEMPHLVLRFGEDQATFKAHPDANQFLLVRHLDQLSIPGMPTLRAATVLTLDQVLEEERSRLEEFLMRHGRDDDFAQVLYDALEACWRGETNLPFASPSSLSGPTSEADGPEPSSTGDSSSVATTEDPVP